MSSIDLAGLMEAASRPDHPIHQLLGALLSRAGGDGGDEPVTVRRPPRDRHIHFVEHRCRLLARRNRVLAEAFGACRCWGSDARCARCGGDGVPGWEPPRGDWLFDLILPLLERRPDVVHALLAHAHAAEPSVTSTNPAGDNS
jgi:hypothetical protein